MWGDALPASYDDDRMREPEWYNDEEPEPGALDPEDYNNDWDIYGNGVEASAGCPHCGNRDADTLELHDFGNALTVHCVCGRRYKLED